MKRLDGPNPRSVLVLPLVTLSALLLHASLIYISISAPRTANTDGFADKLMNSRPWYLTALPILIVLLGGATGFQLSWRRHPVIRTAAAVIGMLVTAVLIFIVELVIQRRVFGVHNA